MKLKKGSRKRKLDEVLIGSGYEVCFEKDWFENSPKCEHGEITTFHLYNKLKFILLVCYVSFEYHIQI